MSAIFGILILAQTPAMAASTGCMSVKDLREAAKKVVASKGAVTEITKPEDLKRLMAFVVEMDADTFKSMKVTSVMISIDAERKAGTIIFIEGPKACMSVQVPGTSAIALYGIATGRVTPKKKGITA